MDFMEAFMGVTKIPPRPDKPSTNSIRHPMYKDLSGRFWPIVIRELELTGMLTEDVQQWDVEIDGEF